MDKKAIKTFAVNAREKLIEDAKFQASLLGITENGIEEPINTTKDMETYSLGGSSTHSIYDD
ncbi:MAG: hypothetical protein HUK28_07740, partial [Methanobrevibacter sp.]|nr:hypothetical protein [Methanobrevibacter sp.]